MSRASVLAAAVALREFTTPQIAAYCAENDETVAAILGDCAGIIRPADTCSWRVVDVDGVRRQIVSSGEPGARPGPRPPRSEGREQSLAAKLLLAEEMLFDCAEEGSAEIRQVLAAAALNHLRQFVAAALPGGRSWWEIDLSRDVVQTPVHTGRATIDPSRVRIVIALAHLTESEAVGRHVPLDDLIDIAVDVHGLRVSVPEPHRRALVDRFTDLAKALASPAETDLGEGSAPARLLSALAWLRARARAERSAADASHVLVELLQGLAREPALLGHDRPSCLYRVLGHLPDGKTRVAVYSDLLQLLPQHYDWRRESDLLPGAIVEAVADRPATTHLEQCAHWIEDDLVRSPFGSESALIGQVVHVFEDLAARSADLDGSVIPRSQDTRTELLSLANVRV